MKVSPGFKQQIQSYLSKRAETDILFRLVYDKENKNIDNCITYVFGEVKKKAGSNNAIAMTDEEVYSLCVHYYDEDDIVVGKPVNAKVSHSSDSNNDLTQKFKSRLILDDDEEKGLFD